MMVLGIGMAVLIALLVVFVVAGMRRAQRVAASQQRFEQEDLAGASNVRIFHARMAELENQREQNALSADDVAAARLELERNLLSDGAVHPQGPLAAVSSGRGTVFILTVLAIVAALVCYHFAGESDDVELYGVTQSIARSGDTSPAHYIQRYQQEAERQPSNPNVWGLLYPLYRDSGRYNDAVNAIERYIRLSHSGQDANLLAELAQARFFAANRQMTPAIAQLLLRVAALNPQQPTMHSLLGFNDFTHGNYAGAVSHWRIALAGQNDGSDDAMLKEALKVAEQRMNGATK